MANEWEPATLTLEHILPKKPGTEWAHALKVDKELADDCTMRLGNMCLLTTVNTALGSQGFAKKVITYAKSDLATTKQLVAYPTWDRDAIMKRQAKMATMAKSIWRFKV